MGSSEAAKAKITLRRSGRVVGTARTVSAKAGATVLTLRASRSLRAGSYSLRVVVSDAAGNATTKTLSLRIVR